MHFHPPDDLRAAEWVNRPKNWERIGKELACLGRILRNSNLIRNKLQNNLRNDGYVDELLRTLGNIFFFFFFFLIIDEKVD